MTTTRPQSDAPFTDADLIPTIDALTQVQDTIAALAEATQKIQTELACSIALLRANGF